MADGESAPYNHVNALMSEDIIEKLYEYKSKARNGTRERNGER